MAQSEEREEVTLDDLGDWRRNTYCGLIDAKDVGVDVVVMGWVNRVRNLGDLIFLDLRDRTGIVQIVADKSSSVFKLLESLRREYVLAVKGTVRRRQGNENKEMRTGEIEITAERIKILNSSKTPPFYIRDDPGAEELLRMTYRYLDLRREPMLRGLKMRSDITLAMRNYLSSEGFWEIETPSMTRSTPEGARDYVVPSRTDRGKFYALAQSPQLFKQLLMVGGTDKYYQIARCYRDEDLRADRQPEFTQLDIEISFADEEMVFRLVEGLVSLLWKDILGKEIKTPFPRMPYEKAMALYGSDKPDTRFDWEIIDLDDVFKETGFGVFKTVLNRGGTVRAIRVPGKADASRQEIADLTDRARLHGAKGLVTFQYENGDVKSPVKKHLSEAEIKSLIHKSHAEDGDLILVVADEFDVAVTVLGRIRLEVARKLGAISEDKDNFLWITEFPLLEKDKDTGEWAAAHHPFTSPREEDFGMLQDKTIPLGEVKAKIKARMYDLVLNGTELASGSIRIHRRDLQEKVFGLLGLSKDEMDEKFGFLLEAFEYGAPPHGGIAFGLDRMVMLMAGFDSIRDVIAFPKTASGACPLTKAPAPLQAGRYEELGIRPLGKE